MSVVIGGDVEALEELAALLVAEGRRLRDVQGRLGTQLRRVDWRGPNANAFRAQWSKGHGTRLLGCSQAIEALGRRLAEEAKQQRAASAGRGGGASLPATGRTVRPGPSELEQRFRDTRRGMERDLASSRRELEELRDRRGRVGGVGNWIGDRNPFDESEGEALDRRIQEVARRVDRLESLLEDPNRRFLKVDASGNGRIIEVQGDLEGADHVIVHVPGKGTTIDSYSQTGGHDDAYALYRRAEMVAGERGQRVAVIQYLDYDAPQTYPQAASGGRATDGGNRLHDFIDGLVDDGVPRDRISVVGHSYGSVVLGEALHDGLDIDRAVAVGSPGLGDGVDDISDLGNDVDLWAGRGGDDQLIWMAPVHGEDPTDDGFGAKVFETGPDVGHSEYFEGEQLDRLVNILLYGSPTAPGDRS